MSDTKTAAQIIREANLLARKFYAHMGYIVPCTYRFNQSSHPQEEMCWAMAVDAYEHIEGTDLGEVLAEEIDDMVYEEET